MTRPAKVRSLREHAVTVARVASSIERDPGLAKSRKKRLLDLLALVQRELHRSVPSRA